ncbi:MAG: hypothetical protein AABX05_02100 [Nanoarchaeota archaeon]
MVFSDKMRDLKNILTHGYAFTYASKESWTGFAQYYMERLQEESRSIWAPTTKEDELILEMRRFYYEELLFVRIPVTLPKIKYWCDSSVSGKLEVMLEDAKEDLDVSRKII